MLSLGKNFSRSTLTSSIQQVAKLLWHCQSAVQALAAELGWATKDARKRSEAAHAGLCMLYMVTPFMFNPHHSLFTAITFCAFVTGRSVARHHEKIV